MMQAMILLTSVLAIFLLLSVWLLVRRFCKAGVRYITPAPIFGNLFKSVFKRRHIGYLLKDVHDAFPHDKYVVFFQMNQPFILIRDPELIQRITIQEFKSFSDRIGDVNEKQDELLGKSLTFLKGENWTQMKAKLSPCFKGSNVEKMIPVIEESTEQLVKHMSKCILQRKLEDSIDRTEVVTLDVLQILNSYFTNVVASLCFAVKNIDFYENTRRQTFVEMLNRIRMSHQMFLLYLLSKNFLGILRLVNIPFFSRKISKYFDSLLIEGIETRKSNSFQHTDIINHLISMEKDWDRSFLTSQAVIFMLAGSDTLGSTLGYLIHEITIQPNIQKKMLQEIQEMSKIYGSFFNIEALNSLAYMDMVIKETLRKWPQTTAGLDRACTKATNLGPPREGVSKSFEILPGDSIMISLLTIHRDPKIWENPDKFDPERFNETNRQNIKPFTYFPFGLGPRTCIGKRLGLTLIKICLVHLLNNFQFERTERTRNELDYDVDSFTLKPKEVLVGVKLTQI